MSSSKKTVLVVEHDAALAEKLEKALQSFILLRATDGDEALGALGDRGRGISCILLDLRVPYGDGDGWTLLEIISQDIEFNGIPVIILTVGGENETRALNFGVAEMVAVDAAAPEIIRMRVKRAIQAMESALLLHNLEIDTITGLYTGKLFLQYASRMAHGNITRQMDIVCCNIEGFRLHNELRGREAGDTLLSAFGRRFGDMVSSRFGLACRDSADTFYGYVRHIDDVEKFYDALFAICRDRSTPYLGLRMGVYRDSDGLVSMERRAMRAQHACERAKHVRERKIFIYDAKMLDDEAKEQTLVEGLESGMRNGEFTLVYQPKFDIRGSQSLLVGAEALVRWTHPTLGPIAPGFFVPLFERRYLIPMLDRFIWESAADQICAWRERGLHVVPISVNVSQVNIQNPSLVQDLASIVKTRRIPAELLHIEITESACSRDPEALIAVVKTLRGIGFHVEMDDFGSGYSSLNMLRDMPMDALKLDMGLVRPITESGRARTMLRMVVDVAHSFGYTAIAEGVESDEHLQLLKDMSCDVVQGYLLSRPLPSTEFERMMN